ncbi:hypothetical protein [Amycolatopsis vastitatis]|uniref:Uncharacterized protein n=1 Tax=Amycolatopsis vastitatis TaxID=1905142 RepID=A0A229SQB3_9PSEU|nr:hypothetical protein [Amycolatopsis vastitatis]OXM61003.1 hypothetical protein CF165_40175 [Amycolatopsis vastitatis]
MARELTQYCAFADAGWPGNTIFTEYDIAPDGGEGQAVPVANSHAAPPFEAYTGDVPQHVVGMPRPH